MCRYEESNYMAENHGPLLSVPLMVARRVWSMPDRRVSRLVQSTIHKASFAQYPPGFNWLAVQAIDHYIAHSLFTSHTFTNDDPMY